MDLGFRLNRITLRPDRSLNWTLVDPLLVGATDVTADYMDLSNTNLWSKTHFGNLIGTTIEQDYVRGDNFFYEGKHYIYMFPPVHPVITSTTPPKQG